MHKYYLLVTAITPSLLMLWYFYARDLNKERGRVVGFTFFLGVISMIPIVFLEIWIQKKIKLISSDPYVQAIFESTLVAGFPEEFFKYLVVLLYAMRHRDFDEPMDGIVYGAAASLGFAAIENISFVFNPQYYGFWTAVQRALTAVPFHATMGAVMGYFLGQAHFRPKHKIFYYGFGLLLPMFLHSLYDYPWLTMDSLERMKVITQLEKQLLPWFSYAVLLFSIIWTMSLVRKLRNEQEEITFLQQERFENQLILQNTSTSKQKILGWTLLIPGAALATLGGVFLLSLLLFLLSNRKHFQDLETIWRSMMFGLPSFVIGLFLFYRGLYTLRPLPPAPVQDLDVKSPMGF